MLVLVDTSTVSILFFFRFFSALTFSAFIRVKSSFNFLTLLSRFSHLFSSLRFSLSLILINFLESFKSFFKEWISSLYFLITILLVVSSDFFSSYVLRAEASMISIFCSSTPQVSVDVFRFAWLLSRASLRPKISCSRFSIKFSEF